MPKHEQHDMREYYIYTAILDTTTSGGTMARIPIPFAGRIKRVAACQFVANTDADTDITFELGGTPLLRNGVTATLIIPFSGAAVGDVSVIVFGEDPLNFAVSARDGDVLSSRSTLEIITDAAGTAGLTSFVITVDR